MITFLLELYAVSFFLSVFFQYDVPLSFASAVAVHECGHMFAAKLLSVKCSRPEFRGIDARICLGNFQSRLYEAIIIASGPLANMIASIAVFSVFRFRFRLFAELSYMMAIVNLLPIAHLDGGQLLQIIADNVSFKRAGAVLDSVSLMCILSISVFASYRMLKYGDSFFMFFSSLYWAWRRFCESGKTTY